MKTFTGMLHGKGMRIAIVISRFNELITKSLLEGALDTLRRHHTEDKNITVAWVPGAFEIPLVAKEMAQSGRFDAVLCLGTIIKGATAHFDLIAGQTAAGIARVALETNIPVIFEVLTTNSIEEALERAGTKCGNKGCDGAIAAIEMVDLLRQIRGESK